MKLKKCWIDFSKGFLNTIMWCRLRSAFVKTPKQLIHCFKSGLERTSKFIHQLDETSHPDYLEHTRMIPIAIGMASSPDLHWDRIYGN